MDTALIDTGPRFAILHALRVKGFATVVGIAAFTGLDEDRVAPEIAELADAELVRFREGRINAWGLTPAGREAHGVLLADERARRAAAGVDGALREVHDRFLERDGPFKELCTGWQLQGRTPGRVATLRQLHDAVSALVDPATTPLPRLGAYDGRFAAAMTKVLDGDDDALTRPLTGSYHDVWMELHEDLLCTLDLRRST